MCGRAVGAGEELGERFFCLGPLHSGVLQQEMHTELSLPVQNCWYPAEAMRHAPDDAHDLR